MSLNVIPLSSQKVIPPVFDYKQNKVVELLDGGENISFQPFNAASTTSNSISVQCNPPSKNTVVDNEIMQYCEVQFVLTATNTDVVPRQIFEEFGKSGQETAPRSYPLARATQNVELTVNTTTFSTTPYDYLDGILRYGYMDEVQENKMSETPTMLDNAYDYALSYNAPQRDPLNGDYFQSGKMSSRGSFSNFTLIPNALGGPYAGQTNPVLAPGATGIATCKLIIQERLMLSPLFYQQVGLIQVSTMQYLLTLGDMSRMLCRRATKTPLGNPLAITNFSSNINIFQLWCKFYTPKLLDSIPLNSVYDYLEVSNVGGNAAQVTLAAGASTTAIMNNVNLNSIPSRIYYWIGENRSDQTFANGGLSKPDVSNTFITNLAVNWQGTYYLTSASARQLYDMSCNNGLQMTWSEYSKYAGSFGCIDVAKDLGLKSNQAVSLLSAPQLGMNVTFTNISNRSINFTLYVKVVYEGIVTNINGSLSKQTGIFSQMDSIKSFNEAPVVAASKESITPLGGIIGGYRGGFNPLMLASIVKNIVKGASGVADFLNPIAKKGVELAESIGLGVEEEEELRQAMNKKYLGKGGKILKGKGGKFISRSDLY